MHREDFGKLFSAVINVFKKFFKDETQHPVGKIDLACVILFCAIFVGGFFVDDIILLFNTIFNRHMNEMEYLAQPIIFICIIIFAYLSLKLIPPKFPVQPKK
jgi:ABC-type Na+ efflux pump permease subunit